MNSEFTNAEKEDLLETIQHSRKYRREKAKDLTLVTLGALAIGLISTYWIGKLSWTLFLMILILVILMALVFLFAWYLAGRPINKMERDLELGTTRTGISKIKRINIFNRSIQLEDGTIVYEGESSYGKWSQGDKVFYRRTESGEHIFQSEKVE